MVSSTLILIRISNAVIAFQYAFLLLCVIINLTSAFCLCVFVMVKGNEGDFGTQRTFFGTHSNISYKKIVEFDFCILLV